MKKIINRKLYDTTTAQYIGSCDNGNQPNDKYYLKETLYRKTTGEYFIHKIGGSRSYLGSCSEGQAVSGEEIYPITVRDAQDWVEDNLLADEYIKLFGVIEE